MSQSGTHAKTPHPGPQQSDALGVLTPAAIWPESGA